jgi:ribosomal protein L11 methyltransferase
VRRSQHALPAVRAGRVVVHGGHARGQARPNDLAILIEAGQAFGTGHHATTRGCLLAIAAVARSHRVRSALDVGTGSGVLAIALAKRGVSVLATDIDPIAARIARANARLNGVAARVAVRLMPHAPSRLPPSRLAPYDLVVANILLEPLLKLAPAIARQTAAGGSVILSGLLPDQGRAILATYRGVGLRVRRALLHDGWLTVTLDRPPTLRWRRRRPAPRRRGPANPPSLQPSR